MITYQDYLEVTENGSDEKVADYVKTIIEDHKSSDVYKNAKLAEQYFENQNVTIMEFQRLLYTLTGTAVPDNYASNYKLRTNLFNYFVTQENQFLLGNGTSWNQEGTADKLGTKTKTFDSKLMEVGEKAIVQGAAFGFYNLDHLDVFGLLDFAPLYDEENGSLRAGVRFWRLDDSKPLRATLYEEDGYRQLIYKPSKDPEVTPKRAYKHIVGVSIADGEQIYDGENYPSFPIVPMYGNSFKRSALDGQREKIDCYDLIGSGFANTIDEASYMYWAIQNAGGMDDLDLVKFVEHMKTLHAAVVEDSQAKAEAHTIEAPYQGRAELLAWLRSDLFDSFMALDVKEIANGATTATQIKAAYEPLNSKCDKYEDQVREFVYGILAVAGIDDEPTWTRSMIVNEQEKVQTVLSASEYLEEEYLTRKILSIMGDGDKAGDIIAKRQADDLSRFRDRRNQGQGDENDQDDQNSENDNDQNQNNQNQE